MTRGRNAADLFALLNCGDKNLCDRRKPSNYFGRSARDCGKGRFQAASADGLAVERSLGFTVFLSHRLAADTHW
jgi:hypothetical protein